jgi:hypothetical protein
MLEQPPQLRPKRPKSLLEDQTVLPLTITRGRETPVWPMVVRLLM